MKIIWQKQRCSFLTFFEQSWFEHHPSGAAKEEKTITEVNF